MTTSGPPQVPGRDVERAPRRALMAVLPLCVMSAWVISSFADTGTPLWALWRPLLVTAAITLAVEAVAILLVRDWPRAALATLFVMLFLVGLWPLALGALIVPAWYYGVSRLRTRQGRRPLAPRVFDSMVANAGLFSIILLAVVIVRAAAGGAFWNPVQNVAHAPTAEALPNVYVLMLDGYPGTEALASRFGIDNSGFDADLEARGFDVSDRSRSNYTTTWLSLASFFQMAYVHESESLAGLPRSGPEQYRVLGQMVNDAPSIRILRDAGYRIAAGASAYSEVALMNADEQIFAPTLTQFEEQLVEHSVAAFVLRDWLAANQRDDVNRAIDSVASLAEHRSTQPTFLFAHIFSPHAPFIFDGDQNGDLPACFPGKCGTRDVQAEWLELTPEEYGEQLDGQLKHLNARLLAAIDRIVAADPSAVIVIFSDHATRYDLHADPTEANQNVFAARTPGETGVFPDDETTVNILPRLLNAYLGTDLAVLPPEAWMSQNHPLELVPLPGSGG